MLVFGIGLIGILYQYPGGSFVVGGFFGAICSFMDFGLGLGCSHDGQQESTRCLEPLFWFDCLSTIVWFISLKAPVRDIIPWGSGMMKMHRCDAMVLLMIHTIFFKWSTFV